MRRFLSPRLPAPSAPARLGAEPSHHLLRVTGIAPGEQVELFDGQGGSCLAALLAVEEGRAVLGWLGPAPAPPAPPERWLLAGLLKGPAFDTVVRMATELGAHHLWPVLLRRSVAKGERADRWERIAAAAAAQCGRADLPEIRAPAPLSACLADLPAGVARVVLLPGAPPAAPAPGPAALLLGPEGGLDPAEIDQAAAAGFTPAGLAAWTLRADTAAAAALARLI